MGFVWGTNDPNASNQAWMNDVGKEAKEVAKEVIEDAKDAAKDAAKAKLLDEKAAEDKAPAEEKKAE